MALSKPQREICSAKTRFVTAICGRRFGKSYVGAYKAIEQAGSKQNSLIWFVAPTYKQTEEVWNIIIRELYKLGWVAKENSSKQVVTLKNGSRIVMRSTDNAKNLRGAGLNYLIVDEFADVKPSDFYEVLLPMLADKRGGCMLVGTPQGVGNWSYEVYTRALEDENWTAFHYTTLQGGRVSEEELEIQKAQMDERTFNQEFNADFVTTSNRIWYNFDIVESVHEYGSFTKDEEANIIWNTLKGVPKKLYIGMDFNIDPMSAVVFAREKSHVHIIDEIEIHTSNTDEMVDEIRHRYPTQDITVYPDPAGKQRKTSAAGRTDFKILQNAGFGLKARNVTASVRDGVNAVNSMLKNANGERRLFVDPKCKRTIECLTKHSYKEGTVQPDKDTGYDHMSDAIRYYIDYEFPIKRDYKTNTMPQRWGHSIG